MKELIDIVLENQSTVKDWKNDFHSEEWKQADELHFKMFGTRLNQTKNCGCLTDFYTALNSKRKLKNIMEKDTRKFLLKPDKLVMLHGLSKVVSASSSEEDHMLVLSIDPSQIVKFERYPENWEEIVNGGTMEQKTENQKEFIEAQAEEPVVIVELDLNSTKEKFEATNPRKAELEAMTAKDLKALIVENEMDIPKGNKAALVEFILEAEA